jgi:hypothetical protein
MPISVACRIWDSFIIEGEVFLYRSALGILKLFHNQLLKADFEECVRLLHNIDLKYDKVINT